MKIVFHTNLDEAQHDVSNLNQILTGHLTAYTVPRVGERIVFPFEKPGKLVKFSFELEVCEVRYNYHRNVIEIELHIPSTFSKMSIQEWCDWFKRHRGQT